MGFLHQVLHQPVDRYILFGRFNASKGIRPWKLTRIHKAISSHPCFTTCEWCPGFVFFFSREFGGGISKYHWKLTIDIKAFVQSFSAPLVFHGNVQRGIHRGSRKSPPDRGVYWWGLQVWPISMRFRDSQVTSWQLCTSRCSQYMVVVSDMFFVFTPKFGEDSPISTSIFSRWVEPTNQVRWSQKFFFYLFRKQIPILGFLSNLNLIGMGFQTD